MTNLDTLQRIEQELLFTESHISDVLDALGIHAIPEEIERELSLSICAGCGLWVYQESIRDELCIDCQQEAA